MRAGLLSSADHGGRQLEVAVAGRREEVGRLLKDGDVQGQAVLDWREVLAGVERKWVVKLSLAARAVRAGGPRVFRHSRQPGRHELPNRRSEDEPQVATNWTAAGPAPVSHRLEHML